MIQTYQRLQRRRAAGEIDGFTLIELLIVIVVLGILAAIVVFALGGVTGKSAAAACQSDAKTVGTGVAALQAENPTLATSGLTSATWESDMTATAPVTGLTGNPFIQTWPSSSSYSVFVGDGTALPSGVVSLYSLSGTNAPKAITTLPIYGDVYVVAASDVGGTTKGWAFNATTNPIEACNWAVLGKA